MAEAEVGLRATLKDRRETAAGLQALKGDVKAVGAEAEAVGARATVGARGFETLRKTGHLAALAVKGALLGSLAVGAGVIKFGVDAIAKASDLNETINKSNVIFGKNARSMRQWSATAATSFGLSQQAALEGAAGFGDMFSQIGFARDQSAQMSKQVVQMAADFGSFNNLPTDDVLERIAGGFRGEYDALQQLIPNISAARVQQVAMTQSGVTHAQQLTAQQKALATLTILQHDGARAMGDFQRTSGSLSNQQKILAGQYDNISAKIGKKLLPAQLAVTRWINQKGLPLFDQFADWFVSRGSPAISDFVGEARPLARKLLPELGDALGTVRDTVKDAAPYVGDLVEGFNQLPGWVKKGIAAGGLTIFAAKKTGAASTLGTLKSLIGSRSRLAAGGSGLLGVVTRSKPVPVFVTNPGFGTGGGQLGGRGGIGAVAARTLGADLAAPVAAAAAVIAGFFVYKKAADADTYNKRYNAPGAPQHAAGSNPAGTATLTAPKGAYGGFDNFNTMLRAQQLSSKYQFDFNTELQRTQNKLDLNRTKATLFGGVLKNVAATKVNPPVTTPGLPRAQTGINVFDTVLKHVGRGATAHVDADTGAANAGVNGVRANLARLDGSSASIHINVLGGINIGHRAKGGPVQAGQPYIVGEKRPELFVPRENGHIRPRVPSLDRDRSAPLDLSAVTAARQPIVIHAHVDLDGQRVHDSVVSHAEGRDARR